MSERRVKQAVVDYLLAHPGATTTEVIAAVGCTRQTVYQYAADLDLPLFLELRDGTKRVRVVEHLTRKPTARLVEVAAKVGCSAKYVCEIRQQMRDVA